MRRITLHCLLLVAAMTMPAASDEIFPPLQEGTSGITAEDTLGCSTERAFAVVHLAVSIARGWKGKDLATNILDYESEECVKLPSGTRFTGFATNR